MLWYPGHELLLTEMVRAENCYLYDSQGKRYLDLESGVWCTSIGHGHPEVLRVIREQSACLGHTGFCYSSQVVEEAAQEILALLGFSGGKCVFLCSGSEAVEYGVRVAQSLIERPLLLTMAGSYFGAYGSAHSQRADQFFAFDWEACPACRLPGECSQACAHWAAIPYDAIGGLLFEPGSSAGLVRFPPAGLIRSMVAKIRSDHGLILVNEVTTGVGRTGAWFGYQHYGIAPDVVAMGKGIGNGYPVSVTAFAPGIVNRLGQEPVRYSQSHQNDPLGAAVARKVLEIMKRDGLIARGRRVGEMLLAGLEHIKGRTGHIAEIRARGLMVAVELDGDKEGQFASEVHRRLFHRGYILGKRPGTNVLRLDPSLTIAEQDIQAFLDAFEAVLSGQEN
ncbi:MAG: aspartate aminotransferase family protein [Bacillota bacterium]